MTGIISELFNQVFVGFTKIILGDRFNTQRNFTEMFNQMSQQIDLPPRLDTTLS